MIFLNSNTKGNKRRSACSFTYGRFSTSFTTTIGVCPLMMIKYSREFLAQEKERYVRSQVHKVIRGRKQGMGQAGESFLCQRLSPNYSHRCGWNATQGSYGLGLRVTRRNETLPTFLDHASVIVKKEAIGRLHNLFQSAVRDTQQ